MKKLRGWLLRAATLLIAVVVLVLADRGTAGDEKDVRNNLTKIADALEKNQADGVKQGVQALQKEELDIIMEVFKLRTKGGLGVGDKPAVKPDGIEAKIQALDKTAPTPKEAQGDAAPLARAGFVSAAVAEVIMGKVPSDKKKQDGQWKTFAKEMKNSGLDFAKAALAKDAMKVHKAAKDLNNACIKCHDVFR